MLSTKHLLQSCKDVPVEWIFEHYCSLPERLSGQDVKIKSLFNSKDKIPSMCIFFSRPYNKYMFRDFSTGNGGTAVKLVQLLFNEDFYQASSRILQDYNKYVLLNNGVEHKITDFKVRSKFKVTGHVVREWTARDKYFWQQFNVGSKLLDHYNVKPLQSYVMTKEEDGELNSLEITGYNLYGYFKEDGTLYKIYQPNVKTHKFIKIKDYLQGSEQLEKHPYLIICSSLKDGMVIKSLGIKADIIVPDSENTIIKEEKIKGFKQNYKKILTLFDNDDAGIKAMLTYKELYGIDYVYFDLEKDVADAVKEHDVNKVKNKLISAIDKKINNYAEEESS